MKTIKISIQDENTLVLQEDGQKGDLIDLKSIHETDIDKSTITNVVNSIKMGEFNARLQKEKENIERKKILEAKLKEQEIVNRSKDAISKKEQEIVVLNSKLETIVKQTESDVKLKALEEKQKIEEDFRKILNEKDTEINNIRHEKELSEEKLKDQIRSSETALGIFILR
jgi:hypothetical protein